MLSYYRTLFDIRAHGDGPAGLTLLDNVEKTVRRWAQESFPEHPEILDDPEGATRGRRWEGNAGRLRLSGGSADEQGHFWLRWHVDGVDGEYGRRYLGFRLATEGEWVQADIEVRVEDWESGNFNAEVHQVLRSLLFHYRCSALGTELSERSDGVEMGRVGPFWDLLSSRERCLPVVVVSERRGGDFAVDCDALQLDLLGLARVASCPDRAAWELGWYSWRLLCYDGQVRIYAPRPGPADGDLRHRSWSYDEVSELGYQEFLQLLRDECAQRIHYPEGRDALRVFSRVRGRARDRIRMVLSEENSRVWDEWDEEVRANEAEIRRLRDRVQQMEVDNGRLERQVKDLDLQNRTVAWRLRSRDRSASGGYDAPETVGDDEVWSDLRTVADVVNAVRDWCYVLVFDWVRRSCGWMSKGDAQEFYDVLVSLNSCGRERASMQESSLGSSEQDWVRRWITNFTGGETNATMREFGRQRRFPDDGGNLVEMQAHIAVGNLRVHLCWSREESRWLVGYYGNHLPIASG